MSAADPRTILLVEDVETSRLLTRLHLERAGYRVLEAETAEAGLELAGRIRADLFVIDGMLPQMDGFQMCRCLRAVPEYLDTPILLLSGLEEPEWPAHALEAGATEFIAKSKNWGALIARVHAYLNART
jgi:sigma-B regulation protein RsbU (phosphoserine phosphatase)